MYYKKTAFVLMLTFIAVYLQAQTPGTLKWSFETGGRVESSPALDTDGTIYVGSNDTKLYALNSDGSLKWSYKTGGSIISSPAIGADGTIYVGSGDNKFYALNPDGSLKWSYTAEGYINSSPAIGADGTIYMASGDNKLYALNPDGSLKWSYTTGSYIPSSPAIGTDGTIYVGSYDYKLYALNSDGSLKWSYTTGYWIYSSPAIGSDGTIYVGSADDKLYAINPDGSLKWSYKTGNDINSSPSIGVDGTIYVGSSDSHLYALNPDGSRKWRIRTLLTTPFVSCPAIGDDNIIYAGSYDCFLHAIKPNGNEEWCFSTGDRITSSPAIGTDGIIYIGSIDNKLYAIYSSSMGLLVDSPWPKFRQNNKNTGNIKSDYTIIIAIFSADTTYGIKPLTVQFTDNSIGEITDWQWDFGDGQTNTEQNPEHTYTTADSFTVSLTVTGPEGSNTKTRENYIIVAEPAPVAHFVADKTSGDKPFTVQFTDSSVGDITSWDWNFGDWQSSTVQHPIHTYHQADTFTVSLTVTGPWGSNTNTREDYIIVTEPTGVDNNNYTSIPNEYRLYPNYPNPFNPETTIQFALPKTDHITLSICNISGKHIVTLISERRPAGEYKFVWRANGVPSGIYLYRLEAGGFVETKKLILQR